MAVCGDCGGAGHHRGRTCPSCRGTGQFPHPVDQDLLRAKAHAGFRQGTASQLAIGIGIFATIVLFAVAPRLWGIAIGIAAAVLALGLYGLWASRRR